MKFLKLDLLILLISLFIFSGCENPDGIGLNGSEYENGTQADGFVVTSQLVTDARIRTDNRFTYNGSASNTNVAKLLGYMNDPIFGKTEMEINSQLIKPDTSYFKFPTGAILDSAVLVVSYMDTSDIKNTYYGDASTKFKAVIEELGDPLRVDTTYYSDRYFNTVATMGSGLFVPNPRKNIWVYDFIKGAPDTLINVGPQIRIPLDINYAVQKFVNAPDGSFNSVAAFNNYIKGIKLRIDPSSVTGAGGAVYVNMNTSDKSNIFLYYHNTTDTSFKKISISGAIAQTNYFKHDYTGTPVADALVNNNQQTVYVQAMAGVKTKIKFPDVKNLTANGKKAINKAELVVSINSGTDVTFAAPKRIILNQGIDKSGAYIQIPDLNYYDSRNGNTGIFLSGYYNTSKKNYSVNITKYIQDILDDKANDDNLFLTFDNPAQSAERAVLGGPSGTLSMKLRIIYSDIK